MCVSTILGQQQLILDVSQVFQWYKFDVGPVFSEMKRIINAIFRPLKNFRYQKRAIKHIEKISSEEVSFLTALLLNLTLPYSVSCL